MLPTGESWWHALELVKKWGLAPAVPRKTREFSPTWPVPVPIFSQALSPRRAWEITSTYRFSLRRPSPMLSWRAWPHLRANHLHALLLNNLASTAFAVFLTDQLACPINPAPVRQSHLIHCDLHRLYAGIPACTGPFPLLGHRHQPTPNRIGMKVLDLRTQGLYAW